jgi:hypothetical protein
VTNRYHNTSSVSAMLNHLQLPTLEHRRNLNRITMLYKITNNLIAVDPKLTLAQYSSLVVKWLNHHYYRFVCIEYNRLQIIQFLMLLQLEDHLWIWEKAAVPRPISEVLHLLQAIDQILCLVLWFVFLFYLSLSSASLNNKTGILRKCLATSHRKTKK